MTIVPSLLVTGILAILVSLIYILWATMLAERKHSGLAMILLSIVMLLVGAGFGSALLGLIVGLTATRINAPLTWWRARPANARRIPGQSFPWLYAACVASWLLLLPGSIILAQILRNGQRKPGGPGVHPLRLRVHAAGLPGRVRMRQPAAGSRLRGTGKECVTALTEMIV